MRRALRDLASTVGLTAVLAWLPGCSGSEVQAKEGVRRASEVVQAPPDAGWERAWVEVVVERFRRAGRGGVGSGQTVRHVLRIDGEAGEVAHELPDTAPDAAYALLGAPTGAGIAASADEGRSWRLVLLERGVPVLACDHLRVDTAAGEDPWSRAPSPRALALDLLGAAPAVADQPPLHVGPGFADERARAVRWVLAHPDDEALLALVAALTAPVPPVSAKELPADLLAAARSAVVGSPAARSAALTALRAQPIAEVPGRHPASVQADAPPDRIAPAAVLLAGWPDPEVQEALAAALLQATEQGHPEAQAQIARALAEVASSVDAPSATVEAALAHALFAPEGAIPAWNREARAFAWRAWGSSRSPGVEAKVRELAAAACDGALPPWPAAGFQAFEAAVDAQRPVASDACWARAIRANR